MVGGRGLSVKTALTFSRPPILLQQREEIRRSRNLFLERYVLYHPLRVILCGKIGCRAMALLLFQSLITFSQVSSTYYRSVCVALVPHSNIPRSVPVV